MSVLYRHFARDWEHLLDFSDEALVEMYNSESYGTPVSQTNGFMHGKKWMDVNITMWKEDIERGLLFKKELYSDPCLPHWWLDKVL